MTLYILLFIYYLTWYMDLARKYSPILNIVYHHGAKMSVNNNTGVDIINTKPINANVILITAGLLIAPKYIRTNPITKEITPISIKY